MLHPLYTLAFLGVCHYLLESGLCIALIGCSPAPIQSWIGSCLHINARTLLGAYFAGNNNNMQYPVAVSRQWMMCNMQWAMSNVKYAMCMFKCRKVCGWASQPRSAPVAKSNIGQHSNLAFVVYFWQCLMCSMQSAACNMQYAKCNKQSTICNILYIIYNICQNIN